MIKTTLAASHMKFFPVFLNVRDRPCLVVGGGEVAARKVELLRRAQAKVAVIAPELCGALADLAHEGHITHRATSFTPADMAGYALVIAATDDTGANRQVSETARAQHIPVNVVDQPEMCTFIMPSIIDRSPIVIAVSSGGASPVLARLLRARLETFVPAAYGRLAALVERFRTEVKARFKTTRERRRFWENILQGPVAEMLLAGQEQAAHAALEKAVTQDYASEHAVGEVYVVGGGPGDPDLLTFRALRLMQQADVVLYDRLIAKGVLELVRRDAERIYVGKARDYHAVRQEQIHGLMVKLAKEGKRVLRLKGGDPFIFGRGGEESLRLCRLRGHPVNSPRFCAVLYFCHGTPARRYHQSQLGHAGAASADGGDLHGTERIVHHLPRADCARNVSGDAGGAGGARNNRPTACVHR
jgi:uroporphyrin-III C-methyltransferase/precorrin-2 dehydrogenase/sirohydrochlorin ferrochelatase